MSLADNIAKRNANIAAARATSNTTLEQTRDAIVLEAQALTTTFVNGNRYYVTHVSYSTIINISTQEFNDQIVPIPPLLPIPYETFYEANKAKLVALLNAALEVRIKGVYIGEDFSYRLGMEFN